jgi:hypothetical protein
MKRHRGNHRPAKLNEVQQALRSRVEEMTVLDARDFDGSATAEG